MSTTITTISVSSTTTTDGRLPLLNLEEIRLKLVLLLRDAADLSAYIEKVEEGRIVVMDRASELFSPRPGCSTTPKPTLMGEPVRSDRLERVRQALQLANEALLKNRSLPIELSRVRSGCVGPDGERLP